MRNANLGKAMLKQADWKGHDTNGSRSRQYARPEIDGEAKIL